MGALSWIACIGLFFYLTPFGRFITKPVRSILYGKVQEVDFKFHPILSRLGRLEYLCAPLRDRLLSWILLVVVVDRWFKEDPLSMDTWIASTLIISFNLLAILAIRYRDGIRMKLAELARVHSNIHPHDFFSLYYIMLSPWPPPFPTRGFRMVEYNEADYRTDEPPRKSYLLLLEAMVTTNTLARMAIMAYKQIGPEYGRDAFDGLARLWGSRIAQLFRARLSVSGTEQVPPLEGKTLLLFNHKSHLDFALNFFSLGKVRKIDGRHLRPRFIAAKDHFIDNPIIYSWISLGKVIENAGMIFINRQKGKGWAAMEEAAGKLVHSDVEIAVYPQGTRAYSLKSPSGERIDAGYYTTFTRRSWDQPLGHLKPGTPNLILDTLIKLKEQGEKGLNVLVVGIMGTGKAGPKGNLSIETQVEIHFNVIPPWFLPVSMADGVASPEGREANTPEEKLYVQRVNEIQSQINQHLLEALNWHETLIERARTEITKLNFPPSEVEDLVQFLKRANQEGDSRPFILIDRIISLDPDLWERFFRLFMSIKDKQGEDSWKALLQEVSERLLKRQSLKSNAP